MKTKARSRSPTSLPGWNCSGSAIGREPTSSVGDRNADAIPAGLLSQPRGMARTEIHASVVKRTKTSGDLTRALSLLLRYAQARCHPTGQRRPDRWMAVIPIGDNENMQA
jgi:hypothetical protein